MSKFSTSNNKLGRFIARNEGNIASGLLRESMAKGMKKPALRRLVSNFIPNRQPKRWLFLVGCYNSGTTILRRVLESHPQITGLPEEGVTLTGAFPDLEQGGWPRMMYANQDLWELPEDGSIAKQAIKDWSLWFPKNVPVFLEKSIDHSTRIEWINRHFENAVFVSITRNGYCVCEGIRRKAFPSGEAKKKIGSAYSLDMLGKQWSAFDEEISGALTKVPNSISIYYEDFMANPVDIVEGIFNLASVDSVPIGFHDRTLEIDGVKHELLDQNKKSLASLSSEDKSQLTSIMRNSLLRNGYDLL